jgi:hypothetical protein
MLMSTLLVLFIVNQDMFQLNWPSSSAQAVLKESALLVSFCNCLGPFLCSYRAVAMHVFGLSVICDRIC